MRRIGFFGGTFNPIHLGHLTIAEIVLGALKLDEIIFIPTFLPPHKIDRELISAEHRLNMVKFAIKDNPRFKVSDFEIKQKGKSYTIHTARYFKKVSLSEAKLFFIVGGDSYKNLKQWKSIDELVKIFTFVAVNRPRYGYKKNNHGCVFVDVPGIDISSSYIRQRIKEKKSVRYYVPDKALSYIKKHKLYLK